MRGISASCRTGGRSATTSAGSTSGRTRRSTSARSSAPAAIRNYVIGKDDRPGDAGRARAHEAARRRGDGAGRARAQHVAPVRARTASRRPTRSSSWRRWRRATAASTSRTSDRRGGRIFESLDEVFAIAERAHIPAEIWHLKTAYKANFGKMPEVLRRHRGGARARPRRHGRPVSVRSRRRTASTPACRCGCARAGSTR